MSSSNKAPNFFTINSERFTRGQKGNVLYKNNMVTTNQKIPVDTTGNGAQATWTKTANSGDMFFLNCKKGIGCDWENYRLGDTLKNRGIYAIAKSSSKPYQFSSGRKAIDIEIVALLNNHVPQYKINGNPKTYWATPYAGNRNDAIQRHPDNTNKDLCPHPDQGVEFVKMIIKENPKVTKVIKNHWPFFNNII